MKGVKMDPVCWNWIQDKDLLAIGTMIYFRVLVERIWQTARRMLDNFWTENATGWVDLNVQKEMS